MNLEQKAKQDNRIMKLLKVSEIRHVIAHTNKGPLYLVLPFEGNEYDYYFVLDAVPVDKKENKELLELIYG